MDSSIFLPVSKKLHFFQENNKIPHILFHGKTDYEKEHIVSTFIHKIYHFDRQQIKQNVIVVNCSGKGIKFIREEIKTFAKMHISGSSTQTPIPTFKTIVLVNADFLTEDAQSALRRSIELFSYNTRFFMIVENKYKMLKPILSRFCEIYIPPSCPNSSLLELSKTKRDVLASISKPMTTADFVHVSTRLYEQGLSSYDLVHYLAGLDQTLYCLRDSSGIFKDLSKNSTGGSVFLQNDHLTNEFHTDEIHSINSMNDKSSNEFHRITILFLFHKMKSEYRCEKLFMMTLLEIWNDPSRSFERLKNIACI